MQELSSEHMHKVNDLNDRIRKLVQQITRLEKDKKHLEDKVNEMNHTLDAKDDQIDLQKGEIHHLNEDLEQL